MKYDSNSNPRTTADETLPQFVTIEEARRLGGDESKSSIYRALATGELHAFKRGRRTLVTVESIRRRLRNLPKAKFGNAMPGGQSSCQNGGEQS